MSEIDNAGPANHQYDLSDFNSALAAGKLPAVSFLKAPSYQDGHAGYSDPLDEQHFLAAEINAVERSPSWTSTAIVIAYDGSDGWYEHAFQTPVNASAAASDRLNGVLVCGTGGPLGGYQDRCGHGPRLPLLVISPYVHANTINHTSFDQTSVTRFIEDNWSLGRIGDSSFDAIAGDMSGIFDVTVHGASLAPGY